MRHTQNCKSTILQFFKALLAEKLKLPSLNLNFSKKFFYVIYLKGTCVLQKCHCYGKKKNPEEFIRIKGDIVTKCNKQSWSQSCTVEEKYNKDPYWISQQNWNVNSRLNKNID